MKNSILLIRPPTVMKGAAFIATQFPLNLASIAASALAKGYDVKIWDFDVRNFSGRNFEKDIIELSPFIVGISCYTPTIINGHKIAGLVKRCLPGAVTVVGGPHVSALPEETMDEFRDFDMGVLGEGEESLVEIADRLSKGQSAEGAKGVVFRKGGRLAGAGRREPIKDLDALPFPARHLLEEELYKGQSHRGFSRSFLNITEIMTSRGCSNRCIFCASDIVMGAGVRFRGAPSVKNEIAECVKRYGFNHFTVSDDTFTLKEDRLYEICGEFARHNVTWNCNARVWPISRQMLSVMARSGCRGITFGVESGSKRILKLIKKNVSPGQIEDAFRWSKEAGIRLVEADVIIGSHPSETEDDIRMTRSLLKRISPDIIMASVIVPYPGTRIYEIMKERNLILEDKKWDTFVFFGREPSWRTEQFSPKELLILQKKMLAGFYFNLSYIVRTLGKMRSLNELLYWLSAGSGFLASCVKKSRPSLNKDRVI